MQEKMFESLLSYCDREINSFNKSSLFLYRKSIRVALTRTLESWEKNANLPLPDSIYFSKDGLNFKIDKKGIHVNGNLTCWEKIGLTALAVHYIDGGRRECYALNYFMAYTHKGDIINQEIGDLEKYSNLCGHFIEQYKII